MPRPKYNANWPDDATDIGIELSCIAKGGKWLSKDGEECGAGALDHYMNARKLLWPDRYRHRWTDLLYSEFIANDITIMLGCASSQKTSHASEFVLLNYWARPQNTIVILSTINMEKLDTGVFGEVKMLWESGKLRFPFLAGNILENRRAITTDAAAGMRPQKNVKVKARDFRKGIVSKPCYVGGKWVGLGTLAGIKQDYIFFLADELQFMAETFISSWPNMFSNGHVKIIGSGNPKHDPDDQLGITAEPKDGWQSMPEPDKTETWDTQFMGGRAVNLVGTDSPNFETPEGQPEPYPKLIGRRFAKRIINDYGENSPEFYTQVKGVMKIDMADQRVITRQLCRQHFATTKAVWAGSPRTKIYALDPSYGGGDLCWKIILEFGIDVNGEELIEVVLSDQIKIDMRKDVSAEDQVTEQVDLDLKKHGIPVENAFYDPYGKGTMGFHFSKRFGSNCPIPVDSGGPPTERPVRQNLFVHGVDGKRRLKTCREHYSKFVTEAWFSVSYTIQADQLRMLPNDAMLEGCARKYYMVGGNKIEVEAKDDFKTRVGHSPNKFDALAIGVEGARQRGFHIAKLGLEVDKKTGNDEWFEKEVAEFEEMIAAGLLNHSDRKVTMHL